ncbi:MAG: hypothetical protein KAV00_06080 [Phycisphaerae bacterium]|nr:hypothetical protein [Phycisphaerae bacterium]
MSKWRKKFDYSGVPRWAKLIFIIASVNWFIFFVVVLTIGGDALDTQPANGRFYVEARSVQTDVSKATWVFSLFYPYVSLILLPVGALCFVPYLHRVKWEGQDEQDMRWTKRTSVVAFFLVGFIASLLLYATTRDLIRSISAWMQMN